MSVATARGVAPARRRRCHARRRPRPSLAERVQTAPLAETANRQRLLEDTRRRLAAFEARNRYQSQLKSTTMAMIRYLRQHWCEPEHAADFDRWWLIVERYTRVLLSGELQGTGTRRRLNRLLDRNQKKPSEL